MKYLIGVDIGTSGTKTVLFDENLNVVTSATYEYPLYEPNLQWAEQEPDDWLNATVNGISDVVKQSKIGAGEVISIGLSGQMHGLVMLDKNDKVLRRSIIWCDQRTAKECVQITGLIGAEQLVDITANPALTGFTASKVMWVKNNEPQVYKQCVKICLPKDYVRYKLTGVFATEVSDASGMQLMNIRERSWSKTVCEKLGVPLEWLPKMFESCEVTGKILPNMAKHMGITSDCIVVGGAGDQAASAIGNGIVCEGLISDTLGTSGVVFAHTDNPLIDPKGRVHTFCHAVKNAWHIMGVTQGAGLSLRWFRNNFYDENADYNLMIETVKKVPEGSNGVIYLPYLMGERTPHLDPNAKGVFFGLTYGTKKETMLRSLLEGIAFSQKDCFSIISELGVNADEVRMGGGGARNEYWRQMFANIFDCNVTTVNSSEGGALGVAILAGVGAGLFKDVVSACKKYIFSRSLITPKGARLDENYKKYKRLYDCLKSEF